MEQFMDGQGVCGIMNDRQLTAAVKNATNPERLAQLAAVHTGVLNPIHLAAILTKLANITKKGSNQLQPSSGARPLTMFVVRAQQSRTQLLQQLMSTLKAQLASPGSGSGGHCARGLANITWALAKLQAGPDRELLNMLLSGFCQQLPVAVPQDIANVLWGVAQLTKDHGLGVLQQQGRPATAGSSSRGPAGAVAAAAASPPPAGPAQQPADAGAADRPSSSAASSTGTAGSEPAAAAAAAGCDTDAPQQQPGEGRLLVEQDGSAQQQAQQQQQALASGQPLLSAAQVHQLLQQLCRMLPLAASQTISNIAWAVTVLQQCHGWCMCACIPQVQQLVGAFSTHLHDAQPGHVQRVVRCVTQLSSACADHGALAWIEWQPPPLGLLLQHLLLQRRALKQYHVASVLKDVATVASLFMPFDDPAAEAEPGGPGGAAVQASLAAAAAAAAAAQGLSDAGSDGEDDDEPEVDDAEPLSPTEALVQGVVSSIFRRVLAAHQVPGVLQLPVAAGEQQQQQQPEAAEEPLSPTSALVRQLVSGIFARVVHGASPGTAAFARVMPQLQRLGLLAQFQALQGALSSEQLAAGSTGGPSPYQSPHQSPFHSPYQGGGPADGRMHAGFGLPPYGPWSPGMQPMYASPYGMFRPPGMQPPPPPPHHHGLGVYPPYPGAGYGPDPRPFMPGPMAPGALPGMVPHPWPAPPFLQMPMGGAGSFRPPRDPFMPPGMQPMVPPGMPGFGFPGGLAPGHKLPHRQGGSSTQGAQARSSSGSGPSTDKASRNKQQRAAAGTQNAQQRGNGPAYGVQAPKPHPPPQRGGPASGAPRQQQPQSLRVLAQQGQHDCSTPAAAAAAAAGQKQPVKPQEQQLPLKAAEDPPSAVSTPSSSSSRGAMGFMNLRGIKKPAAASHTGSIAAGGLDAGQSSAQPLSPSPFESAIATAEMAAKAAGGRTADADGPEPVTEPSAVSTADATIGLGSSAHTSDFGGFRAGSVDSSGFASSTQTTPSMTSGVSESLSYTQINRGMVPLGSKGRQGSSTFSFAALSPAEAAGTPGAPAPATAVLKVASHSDQLPQQQPHRVSGQGEGAAGAAVPNYQPGMKPLQPMQLLNQVAQVRPDERPLQPQPQARMHQPHPLIGSGLGSEVSLPGGKCSSSSSSGKPQPPQPPGMKPLPVSAGSGFVPLLAGPGGRGHEAEEGFMVLPNFTKASGGTPAPAGVIPGFKPPQGPSSSGGRANTSNGGLLTTQSQHEQLRVPQPLQQQPLQPPPPPPPPSHVQEQPAQAAQVVFVQQAQPHNVTYQTLADGTLVQITTIQQPVRQQVQQPQPQVLLVDQSGSQQLQYVLQQEQHSYQGAMPAGAYSAVAASQLQQPQQQLQAHQPQVQLVAAVGADQGTLSLPSIYDSTATGYAVQPQMQVMGQHQAHQQLLPVMQQQAQQGVLQQVDAAYAAAQGAGMLLPGHTNYQASGNVGLVQQVQSAQQPQQQQQQQVYLTNSSMGGVGGAMAGSLGLYSNPNTGSAAVTYDLSLPGLQMQEQPGAADYVVMQASTGLGWGGQQAGVQYLQLSGGGQEYLAAVSGPGPASAAGQLGVLVDFNTGAAQGFDLQQSQHGFYSLPHGY